MHCVSRAGSYLVNSYCDLQEDNQWKKESYEASWLNLVLETRPQYRLTLSESDSIRRESYKQQQVVHFMVLRSPSQTLTLGTEGGVMTEHQIPSSNTSKEIQQEPVNLRTGQQADRQEAKVEPQSLYKPIRVNFRATCLMSPLKEAPHRLQKRE